MDSDDRNGEPQPDAKLSVLPPGEYYLPTHRKFNWDYAEETSRVRGHIRPVTRQREWVVTRLSFVDAAGNRWCRDSHGVLTELSTPDRPQDSRSPSTSR